MIATAKASLAQRLGAAGLDWIVPAWPAPSCVGALMTTRNGGVSVGCSATLDHGPADLGKAEPAARAAIVENRRRVEKFVPGAPRYLHQVHGVKVVEFHSSRPATDALPVADAAITRAECVVLAIRVADCLPVLFTDDRGSVIGAAHAGWRGLAAGVLEATIDTLGSAPETLLAWIGPGIGPRAFEVGCDVLEAFTRTDPGSEAHFVPLHDNKWLADLPSLACRRLKARGVARVSVHGECTYSDAARFHSYRRDPAAGRMAALVWRARDFGLMER